MKNITYFYFQKNNQKKHCKYKTTLKLKIKSSLNKNLSSNVISNEIIEEVLGIPTVENQEKFFKNYLAIIKQPGFIEWAIDEDYLDIIQDTMERLSIVTLEYQTKRKKQK